MSYEWHLYKRVVQGLTAVAVGVALGAAITHRPASVPPVEWVTVQSGSGGAAPAPAPVVTVTVTARPSEVPGAPCDPAQDGPDCIPDNG